MRIRQSYINLENLDSVAVKFMFGYALKREELSTKIVVRLPAIFRFRIVSLKPAEFL